MHITLFTGSSDVNKANSHLTQQASYRPRAECTLLYSLAALILWTKHSISFGAHADRCSLFHVCTGRTSDAGLPKALQKSVKQHKSLFFHAPAPDHEGLVGEQFISYHEPSSRCWHTSLKELCEGFPTLDRTHHCTKLQPW